MVVMNGCVFAVLRVDDRASAASQILTFDATDRTAMQEMFAKFMEDDDDAGMTCASLSAMSHVTARWLSSWVALVMSIVVVTSLCCDIQAPALMAKRPTMTTCCRCWTRPSEVIVGISFVR